MNIIGEELKPVEEPTEEEVFDTITMILDRGSHSAIVEELEEIAEYILSLEHLLEEHGIEYDNNHLRRIKVEQGEEFNKEKKWLLLHFAGKIIKKEGP